ncbi:hypothetical protein [Phenylobacterium sp.]|uniref:hypothetical protein n=1 Tax=Phenylobacterium sp. TaxID=1871053 RepID=UPI002B941497|nr:hypothetical protein [Phenylobacterium sp.]HVI30838.1 hypothetical protein [Phenylobacterium sp.]
MKLDFQPTLVASGEDGEGQLVYRGDYLIAVLVRLSDVQEGLAGRWFLEKGFGPLDTPGSPVFVDLAEAEAWIAARLADNFGARYWP